MRWLKPPMINADMNKKIYTDNKDRIHTDNIGGNPPKIRENLLYGELTYMIRKAIFNVYNILGSGHKEQVYQKALTKELDDLEIPYKREVALDVKYKGESVGNYRPDFVINDEVILELKAVEFMPKSYETQLIHYLKTTGFQLGLLVNFGATKLYIKRIIWTGGNHS